MYYLFFKNSEKCENNFFSGLYGDNGILPAKTQIDLESKVPVSQKLMQKPSFVWFASLLGLNVEYMLDVLALVGIVLSFLG